MASKVWQHPYVNVFKHVKLDEWRRAGKQGDVTTYMDRTIKCSVFRIGGSLPAGNFILIPKSSSGSLGLTGRYLYLLFRPCPNKHFVVHLDVAAKDGRVIRVSFSNMFKELRSTSTWLQFPFLCAPGPAGPAGPVGVRWTCLTMDLRSVLSVYLKQTHSHLKSVKLCANMAVKNLVTSDLLLDPGVSFAEVRETGAVLPEGTAPMPRDMCFPVPKGASWHRIYHYIRFPSDGAKMPFDSIQKGQITQSPIETPENKSPYWEEDLRETISDPVQDRVSLIQQITAPKHHVTNGSLLSTPSLPELATAPPGDVDSPVFTGCRSLSVEEEEEEEGHEEGRVVCDDGASVHVYAHYEDVDENISVCSADSDKVAVVSSDIPHRLRLSSAKQQSRLHPDPILKLNRIIGFGGATVKYVTWARDGADVVYPCHAIIVSMKVSSGRQRFFIGHTDKVSALALDSGSSLLASAQTGRHCLLRLWSYGTGEALAVIKSHTHTLHSLSLSCSARVLCGVGRDGHNKTTVVVWDTQHVLKGGVVSIRAKAHTDVDIQTMKMALFDDARMVSCGAGNVRLWRVRGRSLRSCPVDLGQYHGLDFTDLALEPGHAPGRRPDERTLFVSSRSGHILEIDYATVTIQNIRRLLLSPQSHAHRREKQTFGTGPAIAVNSISVCTAFCATGSDDGFLRLWPLDFSSVLLEAEHEGPVSLVCVSSDGLSVLAATKSGNLGVLDVGSRAYRTLMRSHTDAVLGFSLDASRRRITTASRDGTVRIWDADSSQQLYDFVSDDCDDTPSSVAFHPAVQVFACGSSSGNVRVFDIPTSSLLAEHRQHRGEVVGLAFAPSGEYLYSCCSGGFLTLYSASQPEYTVLRVLGNMVVRGPDQGPDALAVSPDSKRLAFVGPTEHTVTVTDARSLDELLRVDVSVLDVHSAALDSALKVRFSPSHMSQLLVTTSANKILWISADTGRLLREVSDVHKDRCASLSVSEDGCYLLTAGHRAVKVWDYDMKPHVKSQVFIGHSEPIRQVSFTPDQTGVVSVGDAIFFWDFLADPHGTPGSPGSDGMSPRKAAPAKRPQTRGRSSGGMTRRIAPRHSSSPPRRSSSPPRRSSSPPREAAGDKSGREDADYGEDVQPGPEQSPPSRHTSFLRVTQRGGAAKSLLAPVGPIALEKNGAEKKPSRPDCYKHFTPRYTASAPDPSAVTPPPGQESLSLKAVIGYNGNGRSNVVWNPDTGLFVYSCGRVVVVENLHDGSQRHLLGHSEEISTLAATHDAQTAASASGGGGATESLICIWDVRDGSRRNSILYHRGTVQSLAFSRDDLYFLSVGGFEDPAVALWSAQSFELLCSVGAGVPLHEAAFCPSRDAQLAYVGSGTVFFCHVRTRGREAELQVRAAGLPEEIGEVEVTSMCYNANSVLFTGTSSGRVCVWDCLTHSCFMTWEADDGEIGVLVCRGNRLLTGGNSKKVKLWAVAAVESLRPSNTRSSGHQRSARVLLEQEMVLDGTVVSAVFDDVMDMGIVGTTAGTLWYINWTDNTSIRLISGHKSKVKGVVCSPDEHHFVTCGADGSVRVWALPSNELLVQFQVLNQSCECVCWSPSAGVCERGRVAGGYSDGSVRIFNVASAEMEYKLQPHGGAVSALQYSLHGQVLLSGGRDGVVVVSSPSTGASLRIINDHKGAPICALERTGKQYKEYGLDGDELWLAVSADRRVSIWASDWTKDKCELLDWLTFAAPAPPQDAASLPPSLAAFSTTERGIVVYTGYAAQKELIFYCLRKKQVMRTVSLTDWSLCLSLSSRGRLLAVGSDQRVLKLIDSSSGRFQDFTCHSDSVQHCSFSQSGAQLFTTAHGEVFLWSLRGL